MPPRGKKKRPQTRRGDTEFRNQIERMIAAFVEEAAAPARQSTAGRYAGMTLHEATKQFQLEFVHRALEEHRLNGRWNIAGASRALAVSRSFLYRVIEDIPENKRPEKDRR